MTTICTAQILPTESQLWSGVNPVLHLQDDERETTLCGLSLVGMELDFGDAPNGDWPGCKRCAKVLKARTTQS